MEGHKWNSTYLLLKSCKGHETLITNFYNSSLAQDLEKIYQIMIGKFAFKIENILS